MRISVRIHNCFFGYCLPVVFLLFCYRLQAQDITPRRNSLDSVTVTSSFRDRAYGSPVPKQYLGKELLNQINLNSVADAAKMFAGVLVRDYGGIGGLKTVSVRNLGATHTSILYDGIPVTDAQSGQVDLGRLTTGFLQSISLTQAYHSLQLQPARSFGSAAVLSVESVFYAPDSLAKNRWSASIDAGSFGWWKPAVSAAVRLGKRSFAGLLAEYNRNSGNYPYHVDNGNQSKDLKRENADLESFQTALHFNSFFKDSSQWNTRISWYGSARGLPGAIVFFNEGSKQRLWDKNAALQSSYQKNFGSHAAFKFSGKYNYQYTRYLDPEFQNNLGFMENIYRQSEAYLSASAWYRVSDRMSASWSTDASYAWLNSNMPAFAYPKRLSLWNAASLTYDIGRFSANAVLLHSYVHDALKSGDAGGDKSDFSPTLAVSWRPGEQTNFLLRAFYKNSFRMPGFNDLYYVLAGNRNLRPEYAKQYNFGATYQLRAVQKPGYFSMSVDGYYNTITDKIIAVPGQNLFAWAMLNIGKTQIWGLDLNLETGGMFNNDWKWRIRLAHNIQRAIDVTDPTAGNYRDELPYTPRHSGSAFAGMQWRKWSAAWTSLYSGSRYVLGDNHPANKVSTWMTHDLSLKHQFFLPSTSVSIGFYANNLFDRSYDIIRYYPMPGRNFSFQLQLTHL